MSQVIKHKLCRRGKCQKEAKRSSADKGVALSLDDVKRHVREPEMGAPPPALPLPHHPRTTPCYLFSLARAPLVNNQSLSCAIPPEPM